jgi:hypothetical protein
LLQNRGTLENRFIRKKKSFVREKNRSSCPRLGLRPSPRTRLAIVLRCTCSLVPRIPPAVRRPGRGRIKISAPPTLPPILHCPSPPHSAPPRPPRSYPPPRKIDWPRKERLCKEEGERLRLRLQVHFSAPARTLGIVFSPDQNRSTRPTSPPIAAKNCPIKHEHGRNK